MAYSKNLRAFMMSAAVLGGLSPAAAQYPGDDAGALPCNQLCRWWMGTAGPQADPQPQVPAAAPLPTPSEPAEKPLQAQRTPDPARKTSSNAERGVAAGRTPASASVRAKRDDAKKMRAGAAEETVAPAAPPIVTGVAPVAEVAIPLPPEPPPVVIIPREAEIIVALQPEAPPVFAVPRGAEVEVAPPPAERPDSASAAAAPGPELTLVLFAQEGIRDMHDLDGKAIGIRGDFSGDLDALRAALRKSGAQTPNLVVSDGSDVDRLIAGEVQAIVLRVVSRETADEPFELPTLPGYRVLTLPIAGDPSPRPTTNEGPG